MGINIYSRITLSKSTALQSPGLDSRLQLLTISSALGACFIFSYRGLSILRALATSKGSFTSATSNLPLRSSMMHSKTMEGIPHAEDIHVDTTSYKFQPCLTFRASPCTYPLLSDSCLHRLTFCVARYISLLSIQSHSARHHDETLNERADITKPLRVLSPKAGCTTLRGDSGEKFLLIIRHLNRH
jgi:hypothetical protein